VQTSTLSTPPSNAKPSPLGAVSSNEPIAEPSATASARANVLEEKDRATDAGPIDAKGFRKALDALRKETESSLSYADYEHWKKLQNWGRIATLAGYGTAWIAPNPFSAAAIALGNTAKWAIVAHPILHKGHDTIVGVPVHHTSKGFAKGLRRYVDWLDWIHPDAWHLEHDVLHHGYTGEPNDPDLVEENVAAVRAAKIPRILKYGVISFYALTWKYSYYAPNTFQVLWLQREHRKRRTAGETHEAVAEPAAALESKAASAAHADAEVDEAEANAAASTGDTLATYRKMFDPRTEMGRAFWKTCLLPYGLTRFVGLPLAFAPLGPWASFSVFSNSLMAEMFANLYTFAIIGPNHSGDDLYRFPREKDRGADAYVRQVLGSVNYTTGRGDLSDFLQGFLNYQIEHHLFPALPLSAYQRIQPKVKAICEQFGVPYKQEPLPKRWRQLIGIMVGKTSMKRREKNGKRA
jgi:fatty acid desaturase